MNIPIWMKEWYKIAIVIGTPIILMPILIVFNTDVGLVVV